MGKTNPTYRDQLNAWEDDWQSYRRALRREYRGPFDEIVVMAHDLAAAAGVQNPFDVETAILVSVCVRQQEKLNELEGRVDALEGEVAIDD